MKTFDLPNSVTPQIIRNRFDQISLNNEQLIFACGINEIFKTKLMLISNLRIIFLNSKDLAFKTPPIHRSEIKELNLHSEKGRTWWLRLTLDVSGTTKSEMFKSKEAFEYAEKVFASGPGPVPVAKEASKPLTETKIESANPAQSTPQSQRFSQPVEGRQSKRYSQPITTSVPHNAVTSSNAPDVGNDKFGSSSNVSDTLATIQSTLKLWEENQEANVIPEDLAVVMWNYLLLNNPEAALEAHDKYVERAMAWWEGCLSLVSGDATEKLWNDYGHYFLSVKECTAIALHIMQEPKSNVLQCLEEGISLAHRGSIFIATYLDSDLTNELHLSHAQLKKVVANGSRTISIIENLEANHPNDVFKSQHISSKAIFSELLMDAEQRLKSFDLFSNVSSEYHPGKSLQIDPWLRSNAVQINELDIFSWQEYYVFPNSWFNVETAEMFIASYYPSDCDGCNDIGVAKTHCAICNKNPTNFLTCMAANADDDYLLFEFMKNEVEDPSDGTFVSFVRFHDSLVFVEDAGMTFDFPPVAPVVIGGITAGKSSHLMFGDRFATVDSDDFVSSISLEGDQTVIAWIGYSPMSGEITPLAITTSNHALTQRIREQVTINPNVPEHILATVHDSANGTVAARMSRDKQGIADANTELIERDDYISSSWAMQTWFQHDFEQMADMLFDEQDEIDTQAILITLASLRLRGQVAIFQRLYQLLLDKRTQELSPAQLEFLKTVSDTDPGVHLPEIVLHLPRY
jgi:hypothetical protein